MNFFDRIADLAAERRNNAQKHNAAPTPATLVAYATESVFCYLETEIDAGRIAYGDDAICKKNAEFICDGYGLTLAEIL